MRRLGGLVLLGWLALCFCLLPSIAAAGAKQKITSFQSHVVTERGQRFLRIEIGLNAPPDYTVREGGLLRPDSLTIQLGRADKGEVRPEIPLDSEFAKSIRFQEQGRELRLILTLAKPAEEADYRVYALDKEVRAAKPHRLVIEVYGGGRRGRVAGLRGRTIVVDPGHGGTDSGAVGVGGLREKDITLAVAGKVRDILKGSGVRVVMTREDDRDVYGPSATDRQELQARVDYGGSGADVFLSIHCDAYTSASAHGTATYYYPKTPLDALLAQSLQDAMVVHGDRRDRGIHEARFYVCRRSAMPAALVELAFITNDVEGHLLADEDFQNEMAQGIAEGLAGYFAVSGT